MHNHPVERRGDFFVAADFLWETLALGEVGSGRGLFSTTLAWRSMAGTGEAKKESQERKPRETAKKEGQEKRMEREKQRSRHEKCDPQATGSLARCADCDLFVLFHLRERSIANEAKATHGI